MRDCAHDASVGHGHGHGAAEPAAPGQRRPLVIALTITSVIFVVEVVGALISGSLALLADAGHMLTDVAGLVLAVIAATLAARLTTPERTWGFLRAEVLAAAAQAALLLGVGIIGLLGNAASIVVLPAGDPATSTPALPSSKSSTTRSGRSPYWSPR